MPGTRKGGFAAANTNIKKHGEDFYRKIGSLGGSRKNKLKGFGSNRELAKIAGSIGGKRSKRGPVRDYELFGGKR